MSGAGSHVVREGEGELPGTRLTANPGAAS